MEFVKARTEIFDYYHYPCIKGDCNLKDERCLQLDRIICLHIECNELSIKLTV